LNAGDISNVGGSAVNSKPTSGEGLTGDILISDAANAPVANAAVAAHHSSRSGLLLSP
jgi:hypothetical protein